MGTSWKVTSIDYRPKRVFEDPMKVNANGNEELIKLAILDGGPISASFITYADFHSFHGDGVNISDLKRKGGHAISLFGWGVKDGVKFWWAKNSYGDNSHTRVPKAFLNFYVV